MPTAQLTLIVEILIKVRRFKLRQVTEPRIQSVSCTELWNALLSYLQMVLTLIHRSSASAVLTKLPDNTEKLYQNTSSNDYECT